MEVRWISTLVDGRAPLSVLKASFFVSRVKVCRGGVQVVVAMPRAIRSSQLQPHLDGNIERLVRVVWSSRILSGWGSSDRQGASSVVIHFSFFSGRMWSS
jgi:hypothetical protein